MASAQVADVSEVKPKTPSLEITCEVIWLRRRQSSSYLLLSLGNCMRRIPRYKNIFRNANLRIQRAEKPELKLPLETYVGVFELSPYDSAFALSSFS